MTLDASTQSVLTMAFGAIAEEMHRNLVRSAHSTIVRESRDASTALLTPDGELLAQGKHTIPVLLNAFGPVLAALREQGLLDGVRPGDAFVTNDPFHGGQHLDDIALIAPVFAGDELLGYAASLAHHLDLGAAHPGLNPVATSVHQEGLRIPPVRIDLARDLAADGLLTAMLAANIRVPDQTIGDVQAQVAAVRTGQRRLTELAGRYGVPTVRNAMSATLDYAETMMRGVVAALPDGTYTATEYLDATAGDAADPRRLAVHVAVRVRGDRLEVDLTGTDAQVETPVNSPLGSTKSTVTTALTMLLCGPETLVNSGSERAIRLHVPEGTLLNPTYPAPVSARMGACFKLFDAILVALSGQVQGAVIAPSYSAVAAVALSCSHSGRHVIYREALGGGYGAGEGYEGAAGVAVTLTNTANVPVEFAEASFGCFLVEEYALRSDTGGTGGFAGGDGIAKAYRVVHDQVQFAGYSDHHHAGPDGLAGGAAGQRARFLLEREGAVTELPPLTVRSLRRGDVLTVLTAGGGGFGAEIQQDTEERTGVAST